MDELELKVKDFSNYLLDLGFLTGLTYTEFNKKFKEINKSNVISSENEESDKKLDSIYFKDNISKTIVEFFNSMNEDKKKLWAINIFMKYKKKKEDDKDKDNFDVNDIILNEKNIDYIFEHIDSINLLSLEKEDKEKVKNKKNENEKEEEKGKEKGKGVSSFNNFMNKKKNKNNISKTRNNSFSVARKKQSDNEKNKVKLNEHCTFQPNVYKNTKNKKNEQNIVKKEGESVFDRLFKVNDAKKKKEIEDLRTQRDKENIFQPNLDKNKKTQKKLNRKNFDERLKSFESAKKDKDQHRKEEEEKEFKEKFPFRPKRHNSFNKSNKKDKIKTEKKNCSFSNDNLYQRLYDDNKKLKMKYESNLKKVMNEIKDRANHPIVKHNNINYIKKMKKQYNENNMSFDNLNKKTNNNKIYKISAPYYPTEERKDDKFYQFKRIEELYEEYKRIKNEINLKEKNENDKENNINNDIKDNIIDKNNENINEIKNNINNDTNNEKKNDDQNENQNKEENKFDAAQENEINVGINDKEKNIENNKNNINNE